jgi:hypothetical protein
MYWNGFLTSDNYRIPLPRKLHSFNATIVARPPSCRDSLLDIPQEDLAVTAYAREAGIIGCDGDV